MKQSDRDIKNHVRNVIKINQTRGYVLAVASFFV